MKLNTSVELLAPAKNKETAIAAINSGADAIYIGAPKFGARHNASNSLEDIEEIVKYAHKFNVRVHVTLNTILTDKELEQAIELINKLYSIKVDAIIVQDMGIFELAIQGKLPPIELHASTQCDNRTLEKVLFFQQLGVKRVILARELTLEQIENICQKVRTSRFNPNMEIETFIHGALCVSYSGQCYLSASNGGRSANRGECAQVCRKKYSLEDIDGNILAKHKYLLSLKDFNASKHIERLIQAGVKSFKIEGRLKDINYVKNVTAFYRQELNQYSIKTSSGKIFFNFLPKLEKSFNRKFTDYFLSCTGKNTDIPRLDRNKNIYNFNSPKALGEELGKVYKTDKNSFSIKTNKLINPQDGLCYYSEGELQGCLVNRVKDEHIFPNNIGKIKVGTVIYRNYDSKFDKNLQTEKFSRKIGVNFILEHNILKVIDEDGNTVEYPIETNTEAKNPEIVKQTFITQLSKTGNSDFYVNTIDIKNIPGFMSISAINTLRRDILSKLTHKRLEIYTPQPQETLRHAKFPLDTYDYHANVSNKTAKNFYKNCGCTISEFTPEYTGNYKNIELMRTKHCLKFAFGLCGSDKQLFLYDEKGKKYNLIFDCKNCEMIITTP